MQRRIGLVICVTLACATGPRVRPGPPITAPFAPPPGLHLTIEAVEERYSKVVFNKGSVETTQREQAVTEETYEPLPRGGWLVTRTLVQDSFWFDGRPVPQPFSQVNLSLKFTIDAQGQFVELTNADEYLREVKARAVDKTQLKLMDEKLTADLIAEPVRKAWQNQTDNVCNHALTPGDFFLRLDDATVPGVTDVPVRDLERETVVGTSVEGTMPVMEVALEMGGEDSKLVTTEAAEKFREALPVEMRGLTPILKGAGRRMVSLATCQTVRETSVMQGEIPLQARLQIPARVAPKLLQFRVTREVRRTSPSGVL